MDKLKNKSVLTRTISSETFIEKVIVLVLTVLLSGLLIPYVSNEIQSRKSKNEVILQAQSKLLDDVAKTLLTYETLLADISWFKTKYAYDEEMHEKAFEKYSDRAVDLLAEWKLQSVQARNLASLEVASALDSFQLKMFKLQDSPMNSRHKEDEQLKSQNKLSKQAKHVSDAEWENLHRINTQMLTEANELVIRLAKEMKITKENIK